MNTWKLNNTHLNNQCLKEETKGEIKKFLETSTNGNTTCQNLGNATKTILKGKSTSINSNFEKKENSPKENLTLHLKELEKEEKLCPKLVGERKQ